MLPDRCLPPRRLRQGEVHSMSLNGSLPRDHRRRPPLPSLDARGTRETAGCGYLGRVPAIDVLRGPGNHVVAGIMGSRLVTDSGPIWGLGRAGGGRPWRRRQALAPLAVGEDERDGRSTPVRPGGLLAFPFWVPVLGGFEPHGDLVRRDGPG